MATIAIIGIPYRNATIMPYIGVFFPFMPSLGCYHLSLLIILKETLTLQQLPDPVILYGEELFASSVTVQPQYKHISVRWGAQLV